MIITNPAAPSEAELTALAIERGHITPEQVGRFPLLPAYKTKQGQLEVWCTHCQRWHIHGGESGGHRIAHCYDFNSPYDTGGYVIVEVGPMTREARAGKRNRRSKLN